MFVWTVSRNSFNCRLLTSVVTITNWGRIAAGRLEALPISIHENRRSKISPRLEKSSAKIYTTSLKTKKSRAYRISIIDCRSVCQDTECKTDLWHKEWAGSQ